MDKFKTTIRTNMLIILSDLVKFPYCAIDYRNNCLVNEQDGTKLKRYHSASIEECIAMKYIQHIHGGSLYGVTKKGEEVVEYIRSIVN